MMPSLQLTAKGKLLIKTSSSSVFDSLHTWSTSAKLHQIAPFRERERVFWLPAAIQKWNKYRYLSRNNTHFGLTSYTYIHVQKDIIYSKEILIYILSLCVKLGNFFNIGSIFCQYFLLTLPLPFTCAFLKGT